MGVVVVNLTVQAITEKTKINFFEISCYLFILHCYHPYFHPSFKISHLLDTKGKIMI